MAYPSFKTPARISGLATVAVLASLFSGAASAWSISGVVKDGSGNKLAGVVVSVKDTASIKGTTDVNGAFSLSHGSVGVLSRNVARSTFARVVGNDLVLDGVSDGAVELTMVNASGRSLWNATTLSSNGSARVALPSHMTVGAIFLRIRHAGGISHQAVSQGPEGKLHVAAARTQATDLPVLQFKLANYNDTSYAMTSEKQTDVSITMTKPTTCDLPTTFKWKDYGGPVAGPKNGWTAIKDFTHVSYNGKHYVYMTYYLNGWNSAQLAPFTDWADAKNVAQTKTNTGVAPELMYFTPKKKWIMSKQWCSGGSFCWMESDDVANGSSFQLKGNLLTETITVDKKAPIDQTLICDDDKCYIFYADDNGRIYRGSMAKSSFPGTFTGTKMILEDTKTRLFEAVEVYKIKGQKKYLMIVECAWTRYFRAFTATDLGGTWTSLVGADTEARPFAGKNNVTNGWSNDISHGDIVRSSHDEYREIDPCNLQLIYQGYKSPYSGDYGKIPYQMGLLTLIK